MQKGNMRVTIGADDRTYIGVWNGTGTIDLPETTRCLRVDRTLNVVTGPTVPLSALALGEQALMDLGGNEWRICWVGVPEKEDPAVEWERLCWVAREDNARSRGQEPVDEVLSMGTKAGGV